MKYLGVIPKNFCKTNIKIYNIIIKIVYLRIFNKANQYLQNISVDSENKMELKKQYWELES